MAKKTQVAETKNNPGEKKAEKNSFEERLERLEELGDEIRKTDIPLDEAIKAFEEGIQLARTLEKDLEKIESRIEILMSGTEIGADSAANAGSCIRLPSSNSIVWPLDRVTSKQSLSNALTRVIFVFLTFGFLPISHNTLSQLLTPQSPEY